MSQYLIFAIQQAKKLKVFLLQALLSITLPLFFAYQVGVQAGMDGM